MKQTRVTQIPAPDSDFDISSRGVRPAMNGRTGHTLTESTHADCAECLQQVNLAHHVAINVGASVLYKSNDGHTGRVWAYDPD